MATADLGPLGIAALEYAGRGWLIYPQKTDKSPITAHGIGDATADLRLIYAWWREWPEANIALATGGSGLVAIDLDLKKDGPENWARLCGELSLTVHTRSVRSGGGGQHLYFTAPLTQIKGGADKLGPGIDVLCNRLSLTLPPSMHASGARYAWENDLPIQELPSVLVSMLVPPPPSETAAPPARAERGDFGRCVAYLQRLPDAIAGSGGHSATFRAACEIWKFGLADADAWDAARWWNANKCKPQWGETELRHKLASAQDAVGGEFGVRLHAHRANGNGLREENEDEKSLAAALSREIEAEKELIQLHPGMGKSQRFDDLPQLKVNGNSHNGNGHPGPKLAKGKGKRKSLLDDDGARRMVIRDHELRNLWLEKHQIIPKVYDTVFGLSEWRRYSNGLWLPVEENIISQEIQEIIDLEAKIDNRLRPNSGLLRSVQSLIKVEVRIPDVLWNADINLLVCANGVVDLTTRKLTPHSPSLRFTTGVSYAYDPFARAPMWMRFLNEIMPDVQEFLQEFSGYCITSDTRYETAVWLYGDPGGGKSTFITGITTALMGRWDVISISHMDKSAFALSKLAGKTLMISTEQPADYSGGSMNVINQIISGEPVYVDIKNKEPLTITPSAKLIWAMNDLPRIIDPNNGIFRRAKIIHLPKINPLKKDPEVKERIKEEGAGILNWALDGLARLRENKKFNIPKSVETMTELFREESDIEASFLKDKFDFSSETTARILPLSLYEIYKSWCVDSGHKSKSLHRVARDWRRCGLIRRPINGIEYWFGIKEKQRTNLLNI